MKDITYYIAVFSLLGSMLCELILIPLIWKHNPQWAEQRQMPKWPFSRRYGHNLWKALMLFDPNLQITRTTKIIAIISGVLMHLSWSNLLASIVLYYSTR